MGQGKILIVEDDVDLAFIVRDFLVFSGMAVAVCHRANEAYQRFESFSPDLVILDIMLPDGDGKEICARFRSLSQVPILMLSARDTDAEKIMALGLGADEYLTKPFGVMVLVAQVQAMLRRYGHLGGSGPGAGANAGDNASPATPATPADFGQRRLCAGVFDMDLGSRMVWIEGRSVSLVGKEFEVLWFLASRAGQVMSKEAIYDGVWGSQEFGELSTVTVHIRKIREKIELKPSSPQFLKTLWGLGYKLEVNGGNDGKF